MELQKVCFIVNPKAGVRRKEQLPHLLEKYLDNTRFEFKLVYTEKPNHATTLTQQAVEQGYQVVVAVGGDGSVNEVAAGLVGSDTALGILPLGSGNGFAGHLGLGRQAKYALEVLNTGKIVEIDTCKANGKPFVNVVGLGFDGLIANQLKRSSARGFVAYFQNTTRFLWTYHSHSYTFQVDNQPPVDRKCYILTVANGSTFGYGFTIQPQARLNDGVVHLVAILDRPRWQYLSLLGRSFLKTIHKSPFVETYEGASIKIKTKENVPFHLDGEGDYFSGELNVEVVPKSLKIIVPMNFSC